jgi:hypothetical protein
LGTQNWIAILQHIQIRIELMLVVQCGSRSQRSVPSR